MTFFHLELFAISLFLSFVFTRYIRNWATSQGLVSAPAQGRHLHRTPLPRLGGVAIFLAFVTSLVIGLLLNYRFPRLGLPASTLLTILLPGTLIFLLGVYDDLRGVGPYFKFTVQALAAAMLFAGGLRILDLPMLFGDQHLPWWIGLPLTILWVLAITNAFNLIDGLDGLAAGSALFSTIVVFAAALFSQSGLVSAMAVALAGAILGFLRFNFNPATIFLGDCGSLFIGFMLSALALQGAQKAPTIIAVAIPVVSCGLPILETALSILRRFISGRPVFTADREHIHHKLLQRGLTHRQVVIVLYAVSAAFALLSLFLLWPTGSTLGLVLAVLGTGIWVGLQHLRYPELGEIRRIAQRTLEQRQIFVNNIAIRRATEELEVASDFAQVGRILRAAFEGNDFDAFELRLQNDRTEDPENRGLRIVADKAPALYWAKPGVYIASDLPRAWSLRLDLVAANNRRAGSLTVYRLYTNRDLQLDINLLTTTFTLVLADTLDRLLAREIEIFPEAVESLVAAQAG